MLEELVKNLNQKNEEYQKATDIELKKVNAHLALFNNSPNVDLKKRALLLSRDILQFVTESRRNEPQFSYNSNQDFKQVQEASSAYHTKRRSDFVERFGTPYQEIIAGLKKRGAIVDYTDNISFVQTNYFGMEEASRRLIELANQTPDTK